MVKNFLKNGRAFLNSRQTNILSAAFVIMVMYAISAILGFWRNRLLVSVFFPDRKWQTDVYFAAFRIPDIIFQLLVVSALSAAFIPVFSNLISQRQEEKAWRVTASIIGIGLLFFLILGVSAFILAYPLSRLVAPGFSPLRLNLMVRLLRILLLAQGFFVISAVLTGVLQSFQRFLLPALAPVVYNLGIIFGILFLSRPFGIYGPVLGAVMGAFFHFAVQLPPTLRLGLRLLPRFDFTDPHVVKIGRLMLPRTVALAVDQFQLTFAVALASGMPPGRITLFFLAQQIAQFPVTLFGSSIGQATLPILATEVAKKKISNFKATFITAFHQILYLAVPASIMILILRIPVVRLLFGAKGFTWEDTIVTGQTVALFSVWILTQAVIQLLVRGFYALQDTKIPLYLATVSALINMLLSFFLTKVFDLNILGRISTLNSPVGLALASSVASLFYLLLLLLWLDGAVGRFGRVKLFLPITKIFTAGFTMAVFLWVPMRLLDKLIFDTTRTISLLLLTIIVSTIGFTVYFLLTWALEVSEAKSFVKLLAKIGHWRNALGKSEEIVSRTT